MSATKRQKLYGWGHYPGAECQAWRPEKQRDLREALQQSGPILARGLGRSYGDAALQPAGVIRTERLNHFIDFDSQRGLVRAQAGVTLAELMDIAIPRGWFPPVIPGTRFVTLGGAFACNVHGKNHFKNGDFAEHVLSARIMLASGETVDCSPRENSELFWATAGGMGMTGIVEEITLRLKPITSSSLRATTYRVDSFEDMIASFEHYKNSADYMVGWIDHMTGESSLGRGIFEAAGHVSASDGGKPCTDFVSPKPKFSIPFDAPGFLLNRYSMALYNKIRFKKYTVWRQNEEIDFNSFFHPLDRIGNWNRLYGKRGFFQYQCILPENPDVVSQIRTFLSAIHRKKLFSFLAVIKYHRESKGLLTFPMRGYSIALDFPNTPRVRAVLPQRDRWVAEQGGRIYLAKDAMLTPDLFYSMYGAAATEWYDLIHRLDPHAKFTSLMSERLGWKQRP